MSLSLATERTPGTPASRLTLPGRPVLHLTPTRIAVAGCGVVGDAFVQLLHGQRTALLRRLGPHQVTQVLVRDTTRPRAAVAAGALPGDRVTDDVESLLAAPPDVLVEVTGDVTLGLALATRTLLAGGRVITANKQLLTLHGPALAELAAAHGGRLDFEGAVGGAVPIIRALRAGAAGSAPARIRAILNGTTNFILDQLAAGLPYADALAAAQRLGFAEADPTRDVEGFDTADKLRIVAWLSHGVAPRSVRVTVRGIARDADVLQAAARHLGAGARVKLLGEVHPTADGAEARVEPVLVPAGSPWAAVRGPGNRVEVHGGTAGPLAFEGAGAGGNATASALLADLLSPGATAVGALDARDSDAPADAAPLRWVLQTGPGAFSAWTGTRHALADVIRSGVARWAVRVLDE